MKKSLIFIILILQGCATSMSPSMFIDEFPKATKSKYIDKASLKDKTAMENCTVLVEARKYIAPIAHTVKGDVAKGARGVDEWVSIDKGNAYTIDNFEWATVAIEDGTAKQLIVYFNTLLCN
jgi:hypothetical protein